MRDILSRGIHPRSHDRPCPVLRDADHVVAAGCARVLAMLPGYLPYVRR